MPRAGGGGAGGSITNRVIGITTGPLADNGDYISELTKKNRRMGRNGFAPTINLIILSLLTTYSGRLSGPC